MTSASDQAEILRSDAGRRYGDINVYGNAILGDGDLTVHPFSIDPQEQRRQILIDHLDYDRSGAKRDQLNLTDIGTSSFTWIKDTVLPEWLRHGKSAFWICGKPGSGKSTLMRYLVDSHSTQTALDTDGNHWTILHFFYDYRAGHSLGNAPLGMLRTFLLQLLESIPSLTRHIDDRRIHQQLLRGSIEVFVDILAESIRSTSLHICAFIDGLDEYDGHLWELCSYLELLRDRTGMKMCLASRPEPELVNAFSGLPKIVMQEHNDRSIQVHIERRILEKSSVYPNMRSTFSVRLLHSLRDKARGVILWAKLVINEMLRVYDHDTTEDTLWVMLGSMPPELEQLYDRLLNRIPDLYRGDAVLVLNLVAFFRTPGLLLEADVLAQAIQFVLAVQSNRLFFGQKADSPVIESCVKANLTSLLDFDVDHGVRLIHETLATHLRRSDYLQNLLADCPQQYFGPAAWTRLSLDVLHNATNDSAFHTSILSQTLMDILRSGGKQRTNSSESPLGANPLARRDLCMHIESQKWKPLSRLLAVCASDLPILLRSHQEVTKDSFELVQHVLSSVSGMTIMYCILSHRANSHVLLSHNNVDVTKFLRQWRSGRLDLAIAAVEGMTVYLCEAMERSQIDKSLLRDVFDMIVTNKRTVVPTADMIHFVEHTAMRDLHLDGNNVCGVGIEGFRAFTNIQTVLTSSEPVRIWSKGHDPDCRYHGTTKSLMIHWCEVWHWEFERLRAFRSFIIRTGINDQVGPKNGESTIEAIFDAIRMRMKRASKIDAYWYFGCRLSTPLAVLLDDEDRRLPHDQIKRALHRATALKRRITMFRLVSEHYRGLSYETLARSLEERIIPILRNVAANGTISKSELLRLKEVLF